MIRLGQISNLGSATGCSILDTLASFNLCVFIGTCCCFGQCTLLVVILSSNATIIL